MYHGSGFAVGEVDCVPDGHEIRVVVNFSEAYVAGDLSEGVSFVVE